MHHLQCSDAAVAVHQPKHASCGESPSCSDVHALTEEKEEKGKLDAEGTASAPTRRSAGRMDDGPDACPALCVSSA